MSNILFALYHDFSANSAVHVHNFANQLASRGHDTAVAIPTGEDTGAQLGEQVEAGQLAWWRDAGLGGNNAERKRGLRRQRGSGGSAPRTGERGSAGSASQAG